MARKNLRLGELLIAAGLIDQFQLNSALSYQRNWGSRLGACLVRLGYLSEASLLEFLAEQLNLPRIDLARRAIASEVLAFVPAEKAREYNVIPVDRREMHGTLFLLVAMSDPTNLTVVDDLQFMTGCRVRPALAPEASIRDAIDKWYGAAPTVEEVAGSSDKLRVVRELELPANVAAEPPTGAATTEEKLHHLLRILVDKGLLSLGEYERLK